MYNLKQEFGYTSKNEVVGGKYPVPAMLSITTLQRK